MQIFSLDTKKCTSALFLQSIFDSFYFIEGEITTFNRYQIDGRMKKEFFRQGLDTDAPIPEREFALWKEQKDFCFSIIKGKRTPLGFKLIFSLSAPNIAKLLEQESLSFSTQDVQGLYLNFKYDGTNLICTTGTSLNLFTMDKSLEHAWDKMVQRIFAKHDISFEIMT